MVDIPQLNGGTKLTGAGVDAANDTLALHDDSAGQAVPITPAQLGYAIQSNSVVYDVREYGAVGNGSTDDSTAINDAITAAASDGGGVVQLMRATHAAADIIDLSGMQGVTLRGHGSGGQYSTSPLSPPSKILWTGSTSASNIVVKIDSTVKTVANVMGVAIDCAQKAGEALRVFSSEGGLFDDVSVLGYTAYGYRLGVNATEAGACHNMYWRRIFADQVDTSDTVPIGMFIDGDGTGNANVNFSNFLSIFVQHRTGKGIIFADSDNLNMFGVRCEGDGDAVEFRGSEISATLGAARGLHIIDLRTTGAIIARGTTSYTYPSKRNCIWIDDDNATPTPTIETGAALSYGSHQGRRIVQDEKADLQLIGTGGFARIILQDLQSTSGAQAVGLRVENDVLAIQLLGDDRTLQSTPLTLDLSTGQLIAAAGVEIGGFFKFKTTSELTIASGAVTATQSFHTIDTEGDAASDNLDTINGASTGRMLVIRPANDARTVVVKHGTGNIYLNGAADFSLDSSLDVLQLIGVGANWFAMAPGSSGG